MNFKYTTIIVLILTMFALSRDVVVHVQDISFGPLTALAEGDGGGGGGGGGGGDGGSDCTEVPTSMACSSVAGQYGIPATDTVGDASLTTNSCTNAVTYMGGCSAPVVTCTTETTTVTNYPNCPEQSHTAYHDVQVCSDGSRTDLGWRDGKWVGTCPVPVEPVWTNYCTGANDPNPWQIWAYDDSNSPNYKFVEIGTAANGCVSPTPTPLPLAKCTLVASNTSIQEGNSTVLTWSTNRTDTSHVSLTIDQSIGAVPITGGSRTVSPAITTTYTGTIFDNNGGFSPQYTDYCSVTITVTASPPPPAPTCTLSASPSTIQTGNSSSLSWTTSNATTFSINQGIGSVTPVASGSKSVSPTVTTTYTGTATGAGGSVTCTKTVTVTPLPPPPPAPTCTLSASPSTIQTGNSSSLSWTTSNATTFSINQGIGSVTPVASGSKSVSPTVTTTYTGTATGAGGSVMCIAMVTVTSTPPPPKGCINVLKETFDPSGNKISPVAQFTFTLDGGTTVQNDANGNAQFAGVTSGVHQVVEASAGSTWKLLSVTPANGQVSVQGGSVCSAVVFKNQQVIPPSPPPAAPTCVLKASPSSIQTSSSSMLSWSTNHATSFSINHNIGSVTPVASSSKSVSPTVTTTYIGTATGTGGSTTCTTTVTVTPLPPPPAPTCTLRANPTAIQTGNSSSLSWTTSNAVTFSINQGIGSVTPIAAGSKSVSPTATTTYTGTATGAGGSVMCTAVVTVTSTPPSPKGCISVFKETFDPTGTKLTPVAQFTFTLDGGATTQSDANGKATFSGVTPGTHQVVETPAGSTWKLLSVTPTNGQVTVQSGSVCSAVVFKNQQVIPISPAAPTCTLTANPTNVNSGDHSALSWTTTNANTFSIDHSIGSVTPVVSGSTTTPAITANTTFTGTVVSPSGQTATCAATVGINTGGGGGVTPSCSLSVSPTSYVSGGSATLSWSGNHISSVTIDNGVGATTTNPSSVIVSPTAAQPYTYTGTFTATNGQTLTCSAVLSVTAVGCTSNCGGGGGGGGGSSPKTKVVLSAYPNVGQVLGAYIYLSQIPETGLDLGPLGTTLYWLALVGWALALAYLVLFGAVPVANRTLRSFGSRITSALNTQEPVVAPVNLQETLRVAPIAAVLEHTVPEAPRGYSSYDGFKSFVHHSNNGVLSIDDIVKSLSRAQSTPAIPHKVETALPHIEPIYDKVEPIYENVEPIVSDTAPVSATTHVRGFISALIAGDRLAVFLGLRQHMRGSGSPEKLISEIACLLDDAYRARIDGTDCDVDIARMTARLDNTTLERIVASLTTAIDSSYSEGVTGAKLALTRALSILGA